jgi:hypothetical protein
VPGNAPALRTRSFTAINVLCTVPASLPRNTTTFAGGKPPTSPSAVATFSASAWA